ncbi:hypothetical protein RRG08_052745 [Elysia crispata]|uniref:RNA helicase n=1 Tax=Elysia crispata TaxID=231223 RepID=A0AAE1B6B0_9GAST|nr:hypothetical protein RRG08_052745 [Elysia crispata]
MNNYSSHQQSSFTERMESDGSNDYSYSQRRGGNCFDECNNRSGRAHGWRGNRSRKFESLGRSRGFLAAGHEEDHRFCGRGSWRKRNSYRGGRSSQAPDWRDRQGSHDDEDMGAVFGNKPPPHLKGREIGLWYAKRSHARKDRDEKTNRPTVSMDKDKRQNIRQLLNSLQKRDTVNASFDTGHGSSRNSQPSTSRSEFPDSMEKRSDSEDDDEIEDIEFTNINAASQEAGVDLAQYDDYGTEILPSVTDVVQNMSNGDFLYSAEHAKADTGLTEDLSEAGNPVLDHEMTENMLSHNNNQGFKEMLDFRKKLPSFTMREKIVSTIEASQVLVISGETGCGKTTQVPQFILDSYIERGIGSQCRIICTQPRRISAISVAERVAAERCEKINDTGKSSVGYQIRLEAKRPRAQGSILFCTTGIVLKFLEGDPDLLRATHIIIDEIHERDLQSDFLIIILKDLLCRRTNLKVILMSATLNAEMFSKYFDGCPMLNIPGYTFPVQEYLLEDILEMTRYSPDCMKRSPRRPIRQRKMEKEEDRDYKVWCCNLKGRYSQSTIDVLKNFDYSSIDIHLIHHIINHICTNMEDGAILVFVPGWEEIKKLHEILQSTSRSKSGSLRIIPLHSLMPTVNQREVFERPPPGVRKVVIATNIAETSITIDDVVFVIDCGKIKVKGFQPEMNLTSLEPQWVSKANAKQRRGRAGRVQPGHCFHLYTKFCYDTSLDYLPPEILRTRLEELCLQIKLLKLGMIVPFIAKAMEHPSIEAIQHAVDTLIELQALDREENLQPMGYHLARMPVEPHTGKMILFGAMFCCLDPILTIAASLSFKDPFTIPLGKEVQADEARRRLGENSKSDHIMLINAFQGWETSLEYGDSHNYCWQNFLSQNTLKMLRDMKGQLAELLYNIGFVASKNLKDQASNINSGNWSMIRAVLCAGLYPNVAQVTKVPKHPGASKNNRAWSGVKMSVKGDRKVLVHPKSVNFSQSFFESKWMVFYHKLKTSKVYVHDSTMVSPYPLLFFGGEIKILKEDDIELVSIDNWVKFKANRSTAMLVKDLRRQLDKLLGQKITKPGPTCWDKGEEGILMTAIADLICTETTFSSSSRAHMQDGSIGKEHKERQSSYWN